MANKSDFKLTKIYFFRYNNPVTNPHIWDKAPLIIPLSIDNRNILGCNIHWVPPIFRKRFVRVVIELTGLAEKSKRLKKLARIVYEYFKSGPLHFAMMGLRKYNIRRITSLVEIPFENIETMHFSGKYKKRVARRK